MKLNIIKVSYVLLSLNLINTSFASTITFARDSMDQESMNVAYQLVTQDSGKTLMISSPVTVQVGTTVNVNVGNHQSVGIIPVSVNGHPIPSSSNPRSPDACAVMFDNDHTSMKLTFAYIKKTTNSKANITCSKVAE